jgi:hypothetical protein
MIDMVWSIMLMPNEVAGSLASLGRICSDHGRVGCIRRFDRAAVKLGTLAQKQLPPFLSGLITK